MSNTSSFDLALKSPAKFSSSLDNKYVDAQLCEMLIRRFIIFGPVYVKINRLSKESHRPTAILQFTVSFLPLARLLLAAHPLTSCTGHEPRSNPRAHGP